MTYREIELGDSAVTYLQNCLEQGNSLSAKVRTSFLLVKGRITTLLPQDAPRDTPLGDSTCVPGHCDESDSWVEEKVSLFLQSGQDRLVVLEDASARRGDPFVSRYGRGVRFLGDEVYHVLEATDSERQVISDVMARTRGYLQLGFMISQAHVAEPAADSVEWSNDIIVDLATATEKIIAGAYDGEGFLIWSRV
jgi:hypothetical protein